MLIKAKGYGSYHTFFAKHNNFDIFNMDEMSRNLFIKYFSL